MNTTDMTRRRFMKTTAAAAAAGAVYQPVRAAGSDIIKVGLIGCGGRGTGAAINCTDADPAVKIVAMGDLFQDHLDSSYERLAKGYTGWQGEEVKSRGEQMDVPPERRFVGFDAYKKVIECDIDMVIMASPPHFRPMQFDAAIKAGKHVFMEKPVAVGPAGARSIMQTAKLADEKGLSVVAGTQRRHSAPYLEVMKRIHDGDIGDIVSAQAYWLGGPPWWEKGPKLYHQQFVENWSDLEYQIRNWFHFTRFSGDIIVEQHVHNLDVVNWGIGALPVNAVGTGGAQRRRGDGYGNIYDHFTIQYEYPNGVQVTSMCRQMDNCANRVSETIMGSKGIAYLWGSSGKIEGKKSYEFTGDSPNMMVQEHKDLIASMRGEISRLNDGQRIAESTLTAVLGRMTAYTGRAVKYDWVLNKSQLNLFVAPL
ncbi:MAG: Gfo/Idh/MocA family oxidoreductase [candidate division KSB1 bacterium]|nr:Gfo/Idh/MocA family oxidoreductase [candidate division KSB1 bacterium]